MDQYPTIYVCCDTATTQPPTQAYADDAGYDIYTNSSFDIVSGGQVIVNTGLFLQMPDDCAGLIVGRSGLATHRIHVHYGLIDPGYRGEIKVLVENRNDPDHVGPRQFNAGDRIAQLVFIPILRPKIRVVDDKEDFPAPETARQVFGIGSSGA